MNAFVNVTCGTYLNIFGGTSTDSCGTIFQTSSSSRVLTFDWQTAPATIGSFNLWSLSNLSGGDNNELEFMKLYALSGPNQGATLFYNSGTISHNPPNNGTTPLIAETLLNPITSSFWRVEFGLKPLSPSETQFGAPVAIIELDGFAPASSSELPEPSAARFMGAGIAALACLHWRRRCS